MPFPQNRTELAQKLISYFSHPYSLLQFVAKKINIITTVIGDRHVTVNFDKPPLNIVYMNMQDHVIVGTIMGVLAVGGTQILRQGVFKAQPYAYPFTTLLGFTLVAGMKGFHSGIKEAVARRKANGLDIENGESPLKKIKEAYAAAPSALLDYPYTVISTTFPQAFVGAGLGVAAGLASNVSQIMINAELFGGDPNAINVPLNQNDLLTLAKYALAAAACGVTYGLVQSHAVIKENRREKTASQSMSTTRFLLDPSTMARELRSKITRGMDKARAALQRDPDDVMYHTLIPATVISVATANIAALALTEHKQSFNPEHIHTVQFAAAIGFFAAAVPAFCFSVNRVNDRNDSANLRR